MSDRADVAVVGAGIIGLAVARELALAGREVVVLESERHIGMHTSSRNSEVVHAGLYYPPGSLKAQLCVEGRKLLYAYCAAREVAHARLGKVIVATEEKEIPALASIQANAKAAGVDDLETLSQQQLRELEPDVKCVQGLWSPSTGIVDSHALMTAFRQDAEAAGAQLALGTPVLSGHAGEDGVELQAGGDEPFAVTFRLVINCAGPWAPEVARKIEGMPAEKIPPQHFARGHYFVMPGRHRFRHLVYPVPVPGGLGTHLTLDLAGQARFGPDVEWCGSVDYRFDESRAAGFYASIRKYYPGLPDGALVPGFTGVRPKISPPGSPAVDFRIDGPREHGVPGLIHLFGIESPGLTASLALARRVALLC